MIAGLKPYAEMKDSGVEWLGAIPAHWEVRRLKYLLRERDSRSRSGDEQLLRVSQYTGITERKRDDGAEGQDTRAASLVGYKIVDKRDLAVNIMLAWNGSLGVSPYDGIVSPAYGVYRFNAGVEPMFFHHLLRSPVYKARIKTASRGVVESRLRLYSDDLYRIEALLPPKDEQVAIVRFLDHADRRIRRAIAAKQKLIRLLEEQRRAIIHRAVTRGLDPDVRLKPSGVEWFGDVPEHWEVVRFKQRVAFQEGPGIMAADFRESGVPLLRISCLAGDVAKLDGCNHLDPEMVERRWAHFKVRSGDYLLSASASAGAVVPASKVVEGAIPYTGIIRLWPAAAGVFMPFVRLFMGSRPFQEQIELAKSGVAIAHFGPTHLKRMVICLPPEEEQESISHFVDTQNAPLVAAIGRIGSEIELLKEFRTRLVADVVTGKLDVCEAAAALPEMIEPADNEFDAVEEGEGDSMEDLAAEDQAA